jgi:Tfp pilus assembly protein PilZ
MPVINSDLAKIEAVLEKHPAIHRVAVVDHRSSDGKNHLVAYLVGDLAVDRIPVQSQCWCDDQEGNRVKLSIADISYNGVCLLNTPRSWFLGKIVYLYLDLPTMAVPVKIPAKVVWHQRPQFSLKTVLEALGFNGVQTSIVKDRTGVLFDLSSPAIKLIHHTIKSLSQSSGSSVQDLRRSEPRVPLHTNVGVHFPDGRIFGWVTENISLTGIRIEGINSTWKKGMNLRLKLRLPGSSQKLDLPAIVWWHKGSQAGLRLHLTKEEESIIYQSIECIIATQGLYLENLRRFLATNLPSELIPHHFVMLEEMPLDAQGKIDPVALPQPEFLP